MTKRRRTRTRKFSVIDVVRRQSVVTHDVGGLAWTSNLKEARVVADTFFLPEYATVVDTLKFIKAMRSGKVFEEAVAASLIR